MKNEKLNLIFVALVLLGAIPIYAVDCENYLADPSTSALSYLRLPVSARVAALGGAVSALGNDAACAMINPALVTRAKVTRITASCENLTLDRRHYFAGILYPMDFHLSVVGLGWVQVGVDKVQGRDEYGFPEDDFSDLENTVVLWYGLGITKNLFAGASGKYHMQELDNSKAKGFSGDVGIFYQPIKKLNLALVGQNLGWRFKWDTGEDDKLFPSLRVGAGIDQYREHLSISSDLEWTTGNYPQGHGGIEYWIRPQFCIRAGAQVPNPIQGSGGFGIRYKAISIDYSFTYHQSGLGHSHLFSLCVDIGKTTEVKENSRL